MAALGLFAGGWSAFGPDWEEGKTDAGDTLATAMAIMAPPGNPPLNSIAGCLGCTGGEVDFEDLYVITISDPSTFFASTVTIDGGATTFDSKLLVFDASGRAILGNDDVTPLDSASRIEAEASEECPWAITEPGLYFLAITSSGRHAQVDSQVGTTNAFPASPGDEIFCATTHGHENPLAGWDGAGSQGTYTIALSGATGLARCLSFCPADFNIDGRVDGIDLGMLFSMWGTATCIDLAGGPTMNSADLGIMLASWGPC